MEAYLRNLIKVLGIGAAFASIPLFASFAALQPPWPPAIGQVSAALVLLASLAAWEWTRNARRVDRRRWIIVGIVLTLVGLLLYLMLYSLFVETVPGSDIRLVRGYACTADALLVYPNACPDLPSDALRSAEWEPLNLWTRSSVTVVRVALTASWLVFTAGLIVAVGAIVAGRRFGGGGDGAER
jgi:CDP-diglyceride synthetase